MNPRPSFFNLRILSLILISIFVSILVSISPQLSFGEVQGAHQPIGNLHQMPSRCLSLNLHKCQITAFDGKAKLKINEAEFHLAKGSSIFRDSRHGQTTFRLLFGEVFVQTSQWLTIQHGKVQLNFNGDFFLKRVESKLQVSNLRAEVKNQTMNSLWIQTPPMGFEIWYTGLVDARQINQGVLQPIGLSQIAENLKNQTTWNFSQSKEYLKNFQGPFKNSVKMEEAGRLQDQWHSSVEQSATLYTEVAKLRQIQAQEAKLRQVASEKKRLDEERALRRLFREKYFNPDISQTLD
jgi:hypothetical protein